MAGNQAGQVRAAEKLLLVGLLGQQALKLPRAGDSAAEAVDDKTLGLPGVTQDKEVFPGEQGDGDGFD